MPLSVLLCDVALTPPPGLLCRRLITITAPGHSAFEGVWTSVPEEGVVCH